MTSTTGTTESDSSLIVTDRADDVATRFDPSTSAGREFIAEGRRLRVDLERCALAIANDLDRWLDVIERAESDIADLEMLIQAAANVGFSCGREPLRSPDVIVSSYKPSLPPPIPPRFPGKSPATQVGRAMLRQGRDLKRRMQRLRMEAKLIPRLHGWLLSIADRRVNGEQLVVIHEAVQRNVTAAGRILRYRKRAVGLRIVEQPGQLHASTRLVDAKSNAFLSDHERMPMLESTPV